MNTAHLHAASLEPKGHLTLLLRAAQRYTTRLARRRAFQKAFLPLLEERDDILSDIGYRRSDIQRALRLPVSKDALAFLEEKRHFHAWEDHHTRLKR